MKKYLIIFLIQLYISPASAFWGGDLIYLSKILQQSIFQLEQLQKITGTNKETLRLIKDTNRGLHEAMYIGEALLHNCLKLFLF